MLRVLTLLLIFLIVIISLSTAHAQTRWLTSKLIQLESNIENGIQIKFRDFRLVRKVEIFQERFNATNTIEVSSDPVGAVATLHNIRTGEPLESCKTPCELNVDYTTTYILMFYKYGHLPHYFPVGNGDEIKDVWLGKNYVDLERKHINCRKAFKGTKMTDSDAEPCVRVPPIMPQEAQKSGHCNIIFDVSKEGRPKNIKANYCTEPHFESPSIEAVTWWFYNPKVERGSAVERVGVKTKMSFRLNDEDGRIIDEEGNVIDAQ